MIKNYKLELVALFVLCFPCIFNAMNNDGKTQDVVVVALNDPIFPDYESLEKNNEFIRYHSEGYKNQNQEYCEKLKSRYTTCYNDLCLKNPYFDVSKEEILEYWKEMKKYTNKRPHEPILGRSVFNDNNYYWYLNILREIKRGLFEKQMDDLEKTQKRIRKDMIEVVGKQKYEIRHKNFKYSTLMFFEISDDQKERLSQIEGVSKVLPVKDIKWNILKQLRNKQKKSLLEIKEKQFNDAREKSFCDEKK